MTKVTPGVSNSATGKSSKPTRATFDAAIATLQGAIDSGQIRKITGNGYTELLINDAALAAIAFLPAQAGPRHERGEARLRFQQSRQLPPAERQKQWEAYQALSDEEKRMAIAFDREVRSQFPDAFLHGECRPLEEIELSRSNDLFTEPCETGGCFV